MNKIQLYDGDGLEISIKSNGFKFQCCSCGFVHNVDIEHIDKGFILRFMYKDNQKLPNPSKDTETEMLNKLDKLQSCVLVFHDKKGCSLNNNYANNIRDLIEKLL